MPNSHTKRSPEFQAEIDVLIRTLRNPKGEMPLDMGRLIEILRNNTTDSGCVVKAAEDEPIFVLRGQDKFSATLVMAWAQLYDEVVSFLRDQKAAWRGTIRSTDAMECAEQMARYHTRKFPD